MIDNKLRIVAGNTFATAHTITANDVQGQPIPDFDLQQCTDIQVYARNGGNYKPVTSWQMDDQSVVVFWYGKQMKLGGYDFYIAGKYDGMDWRTCEATIFEIVQYNEEANIPADAIMLDGTYIINDAFTLITEISGTPSDDLPLMDGTADAGTSAKYSRGDHRHPSDTNKQDVIADLSAIRSGAAAGATAYQKPSTGIPKTDLASAVQTSLGKADTALQPSDTVNSLNSSATDKPLSAAQGKVLNESKVPFANVGYYECTSNAGSTKSFTAEGYTLTAGGCIKVKMTNRNSKASGLMNINSTGYKPLWYNGALATAKNTWLAGDTLLVYYDGTVYQSYNLSAQDLTPISRGMYVGRNYLMDSSYKYVINEAYDSVAIPIQYGSNKMMVSGFANIYRLRFWDSVNIFDGTAHEPLAYYSNGSNNLWYDVPEGAVMAVISISKTSREFIDYANYFVEFSDDMLGLWTKITITSNQIIDYTRLGFEQSSSGEWITTPNARCSQMIPVKGGQKISYNNLLVYSKSHSSQTLNQGSHYGAFDINGNFIRTYSFLGTYTDSTNTYIKGTFEVDNDASIAGIKILLKSASASSSDYTGSTFACFGDTLLTEDTYSEIGNGKFYFPDELLTKIYEGADNLKNIRILSIGNSYSEDAFSYVPYIMRSICPNVKLTFGLAIHGGATLQQHLGWFTNEESEYTYYKYTPTIDNGSDVAWENKGSKTGQQIVADEDWDMIILQQGSSYQPDWTTYQPYLNQLIDFLQGIMTHDVRFAWMQVQCRDFTETHDTTWQGIITATQNVMNQTVIQDLIPVGTAIENARTTNLDLIGSDTHMNYNNHLQEGIGCQIAAYMATMKFIELFDLGGKSIMFDTSRMTAAYLADKSIPGAHGTSVGVTDYNCYAGQMSAIMASKTPYVVSDMVTLGLVDNSKIVTT